MAFGTVIAGVYLVGLILISFYVLADSFNRMSTASLMSLDNEMKIKMEALGSAVEITNITVSSDRTRLYVNLTNTGDVKITRSQFVDIDILLTYANSSGMTQTYWCYYNSSEPNEPRWTLNSTITPNPSPEVLNPLDWDPSKSLAITIQLASSNNLLQGSTGYLKVILPQGTSNGKDFVAALE